VKKLEHGIISCIGNTPLVRLNKVIEADFCLYAKLEGFNPSGSLKDRPALEIVRHGIESGKINENTVVIEASSGNMGIGLAQICRYLGLRFICVIDSKTTSSNQQLLKIYGAEVEVVTRPEPVTGDLLQTRINRARQIAESIDNSFWANQYANLSNAGAHRQTMAEIVMTLHGPVDYLFCSASSCGTIRGCSDYLHEHGFTRTKICVADSPGSVIFGGIRGNRSIPGHGAGIRPTLHQDGLVDQCVPVSDLECVAGCRLLLSREALLVGGSSGATLMAVRKIASEIPPGSTCVMIFPDRGERYLDTIFSDQWVMKTLGSLPEEYLQSITSEHLNLRLASA
jgi:2,3-diaminopropionate biosynthesis protein SbnA